MNFDGFISYSHAADGRLAPALQRGLHRLAKPWHRRRALWIFRDQTGLSVTPGLWSSIQNALDGSEWFLLLASPEAARSPWVNREIEHWITTKPANRILPVVTAGKWQWDPERGDLTPDSTAAPDALRGVFAEEPLYLDLRWARDDRHLSLQHSQFRDAIAQLAAPMHGISKDELEGEDVRQHRRATRLRWVAVAALVLLAGVASLAGTLAGHNADRATASAAEARHQEQLADQQRGNAERSAQEAQRQQENARSQEARALAATTDRKTQEERAREQQGVAERAAAEAKQQQTNASRQQQLAKRAQTLAAEQKAVAREQSKLAQQSATQTSRQRIIAEQQQRLAADAAAEAEQQKHLAQQQQRMAEEAAAEARRQEAAARENEQKAKLAAEEARRQEEKAAEQQQIAIARRLLNQAKATADNDPAMALRLGLAAQKIQPGAETRSELAGLLTATRFEGTIDNVYSAAYGPNDVVAVLEPDFTASLWKVANRTAPVRLARLDGTSFTGEPVFSPDGRTLAVVGGWDFRTMLFDVSDPAHPELLGTVPLPFASRLTFSPDGRTLAVVDTVGGWSLWDLTDRRSPALLSRRLKAYGTPVTFSPDGRTVVTADGAGTVWDITDRANPTEVGTLDGKWRVVAFSPTRPILATTDDAGNLVLWHLDDLTAPQLYFKLAVRADSATFSGDGLTLATTDRLGTARLWDMTDGRPAPITDVNDHNGAPWVLAFSPDGRTLATAQNPNYTLSLWTVEAHGEPKVSGRVLGDYQDPVAVALTTDGRRLTTVHDDGTATVWDPSDSAGPVARATVRVSPDRLGAAAISPSGDTVAALGWAKGSSVTLTDLHDPNAPATLAVLPSTNPISPVLAFGPDGRTLAVLGEGDDVELWDLADRQRPVRLAGLEENETVYAIEFSPDGRTLAVATGRKVSLWNMADRSNPVPLGMLKGHTGSVLSVAFSPDGRTLATGSADSTAALWNVADQTAGRRHAILIGIDAPVRAVAFAPDGRTLAAGAHDTNTVTLWDVAALSGPVRVTTMRRAEVRSKWLLFHPDGRTLTTGGPGYDSKRAVQWDYSALNDLRANPVGLACAVSGGGFTPDEWAAYLPDAPYQPTCPG